MYGASDANFYPRYDLNIAATAGQRLKRVNAGDEYVNVVSTHTCYRWSESEVWAIACCCCLRRSCRCGSVCSDTPDLAVFCTVLRKLEINK